MPTTQAGTSAAFAPAWWAISKFIIRCIEEETSCVAHVGCSSGQLTTAIKTCDDWAVASELQLRPARPTVMVRTAGPRDNQLDRKLAGPGARCRNEGRSTRPWSLSQDAPHEVEPLR